MYKCNNEEEKEYFASYKSISKKSESERQQYISTILELLYPEEKLLLILDILQIPSFAYIEYADLVYTKRKILRNKLEQLPKETVKCPKYFVKVTKQKINVKVTIQIKKEDFLKIMKKIKIKLNLFNITEGYYVVYSNETVDFLFDFSNSAFAIILVAAYEFETFI